MLATPGHQPNSKVFLPRNLDTLSPEVTMRRRPWTLALPLVLPLLLAGCRPTPPQLLDNPNLGIKALFPGPTTLNRHLDETPFGVIDWFDTIYFSSGRLDEIFHIEVGNLPPGKQGGETPEAVLTTYKKYLDHRLGHIDPLDLPKEQGPGFRYRATGPQGSEIGGIAVVRRGRIHHAQATVPKPSDPRLKAFLDSFEVAK
jgi:hypothetical protein